MRIGTQGWERKTVASTSLSSKAEQFLGIRGRPNTFTRWYADKVENPAYLKAAWCAMFISYVANTLGLSKQVGSFAYCPYWVQWFKENKRWGKTPKPNAIVFFDWNHDGEADHVGIVSYVKGNKIYTIEGNKGDKVERVERTGNVVLGYGYPSYPTVKPPKVHVVQRGDTLIAIANYYYHDPNKWRVIYTANKTVIGKNPAIIRPGMKLTLP